jgi:hypothetical protein
LLYEVSNPWESFGAPSSPSGFLSPPPLILPELHLKRRHSWESEILGAGSTSVVAGSAVGWPGDRVPRVLGQLRASSV